MHKQHPKEREKCATEHSTVHTTICTTKKRGKKELKKSKTKQNINELDFNTSQHENKRFQIAVLSDWTVFKGEPN